MICCRKLLHALRPGTKHFMRSAPTLHIVVLEGGMNEPRRNAPGSSTPPIYTEGDFDFVDAGIRREVTILSQNGIETFESCEGGPGHAFPEPTALLWQPGARVAGILDCARQRLAP